MDLNIVLENPNAQVPNSNKLNIPNVVDFPPIVRNNYIDDNDESQTDETGTDNDDLNDYDPLDSQTMVNLSDIFENLNVTRLDSC